MYSEVVKSLGQSLPGSPELELENPALARTRGPRQRRSSSQFLRPNVEDRTEVDEEHLPFLHLKRKTGHSWAYSQKLTNICESLRSGCKSIAKHQTSTFLPKLPPLESPLPKRPPSLLVSVKAPSVSRSSKVCFLAVLPVSSPPRATAAPLSITTRASSTSSVRKAPSSSSFPSTELPVKTLKLSSTTSTARSTLTSTTLSPLPLSPRMVVKSTTLTTSRSSPIVSC